MFKALHLCTQWFRGGTLAQVWVPTWNGDRYVLTTNEQPFIHDGRLSEYREVSRMFTFAAEVGTSSLLGLPGRVFTSKVPEWTSNVTYYNKEEYLRVRYAVDHDVRGSLALPVFEDSLERRCCAVLEIVSTEERPDFDSEMDNICRALQAVDLTSTRSPLLPPKVLMNRSLISELVEEEKPGIRILNDELQRSDREPANSYRTAGMSNSDPIKKRRGGSSRQMEERGNKSEKYISLSVLQQYFSKSLKDAAKSLNVSPTTLKKICRQHKIARWPSRKLKKVDSSLKKIQSVLESVPGMDGGLEFDPTKGQVFAPFSITGGEGFGRGKNLSGLSERPDTLVLNPATSEVIDVERQEYNMTDSTNMSESMLMKNASSLSSGSFDEKLPSRREPSYGDSGTKIAVKATLGGNTVRFKFEPGFGCLEVYLEVAKRFELETGEFQLRYVDDDEEWVVMATDSDLVECLEVLEILQTRTLKLGVNVSTRSSGTDTRSLARSN